LDAKYISHGRDIELPCETEKIVDTNSYSIARGNKRAW